MPINPNETPEERALRFAEGMSKAGAVVDAADSAPDTFVEKVVEKPAAKAEEGKPAAAAAPASDAKPAEVSAAAATLSRWKRKIKVLDDEREFDLEAMPEAELDALIGKGAAHETVRERLRAQRDEAREALESAKGSAASERDKAWLAELAEAGQTLVKDPSRPRGVRIVPLKTQTASAAGGAPNQTDLDALEKRAVEEMTAEAWTAYTRAIRALIPKAMGEADVSRIVESRLEAGRRESAEAQSHQEKVRDFNAKFDAVKLARKADFALAGDDADHYEADARSAAFLESARKPNPEDVLPDGKLRPGSTFVPPTEESVFRAYHAHADRVKRGFSVRGPVVDPAKPRAKAPTVLPSNGAAAADSVPTDPKKIDRSTPEGKRQATAYLEKLARERGIYSGQPA